MPASLRLLFRVRRLAMVGIRGVASVLIHTGGVASNGISNSALPLCRQLRAATLHAAVVACMVAPCGNHARIVAVEEECSLRSLDTLCRTTFTKLDSLCGAWVADGARCSIIDNASCSMFHIVMASRGPHVYAVRAGRPPPRRFLRCGTCPARLLVRDWLTLLISVRVIVADRCTPFALNRVASFLDTSQTLVRRGCCGYVPICAWLRGPSQRQSCCCGNIAAGLHSSS